MNAETVELHLSGETMGDPDNEPVERPEDIIKRIDERAVRIQERLKTAARIAATGVVTAALLIALGISDHRSAAAKMRQENAIMAELDSRIPGS